MKYAAKIEKLRSKVKTVLGVTKRQGARGLVNVANVAYSRAFEPDFVSGWPLFIVVETTIACNLSCTICTNPEFDRPVTLMSPEQFETILDKIPTLAGVGLTGVGEPLTNKNIMRMVRAAKARGLGAGFTTNGTIMPSETVEEICDVGLDWLNFSIDGATKDTFEKIRVGADFGEVLKNIERLMTALDGQRRTDVAISFVGQSENIHELPELVRLVGKLGINNIYVRSIQVRGSEDLRKRNEERSILAQMDRFRTYLEEASRTASALGVTLWECRFPDPQLGRRCQWPWRSCFISVEGFVTPCCLQGSDPRIINFGNIFEMPFRDIWNSPDYQTFRRRLKSPDIPEVCVGCTNYYNSMSV